MTTLRFLFYLQKCSREPVSVEVDNETSMGEFPCDVVHWIAFKQCGRLLIYIVTILLCTQTHAELFDNIWVILAVLKKLAYLAE